MVYGIASVLNMEIRLKQNSNNMYLTQKELDALNAAIDFIGTNADGADDYAPYQEMQTNLRSIWSKGIKYKKKTKKK